MGYIDGDDSQFLLSMIGFKIDVAMGSHVKADSY